MVLFPAKQKKWKVAWNRSKNTQKEVVCSHHQIREWCHSAIHSGWYLFFLILAALATYGDTSTYGGMRTILSGSLSRIVPFDFRAVTLVAVRRGCAWLLIPQSLSLRFHMRWFHALDHDFSHWLGFIPVN